MNQVMLTLQISHDIKNLGDIRNENLFVHPALKMDFLGMPLPKDFRTASAVIFCWYLLSKLIKTKGQILMK
mgnify:CR=1 FL=1